MCLRSFPLSQLGISGLKAFIVFGILWIALCVMNSIDKVTGNRKKNAMWVDDSVLCRALPINFIGQNLATSQK